MVKTFEYADFAETEVMCINLENLNNLLTKDHGNSTLMIHPIIAWELSISLLYYINRCLSRLTDVEE